MELVRIITDADTGAGLYAVRFPGEDADELTRLFRLWTSDIQFLFDFFTEHKARLMRGYYNGVSVQEAVMATRHEADELHRKLLRIARGGLESRGEELESLFLALDDRQFRRLPLQESKLRGRVKKKWLRLYAIRFDVHCYVITGGAIKLTRSMDEAVHLQHELDKLAEVKRFLIRNDLGSQFDLVYLESNNGGQGNE